MRKPAKVTKKVNKSAKVVPQVRKRRARIEKPNNLPPPGTPAPETDHMADMAAAARVFRFASVGDVKRAKMLDAASSVIAGHKAVEEIDGNIKRLTEHAAELKRKLQEVSRELEQQYVDKNHAEASMRLQQQVLCGDENERGPVCCGAAPGGYPY